jgi:hypothetical protein
MTEDDLKSDVRHQTGYTDTGILSADALDTAYRNAKRHLRVEASLDANLDWFDPDAPEREEALYWWTCLFAKVATGELDAQNVQIGAVDADTLLAKADNDVTTWFRNAQAAKRSLTAATTFRSVNVSRDDDRDYGSDRGDAGSGLGSDSLTGGS